MAEAAREECGLDRVVFVPCRVSPFKDRSAATAEQRLEMVEAARREAGLGWAEVSRCEVDRPGPSHSWETAAQFAELAPEAKWHWILGVDQWDEIEFWARPERLRRMLHFIVLTRDGREVRPREGWRCTAVTFSHPASSSAIRENAVAHEDWLTPGVVDYCRRRGLYGLGDSA